MYELGAPHFSYVKMSLQLTRSRVRLENLTAARLIRNLPALTAVFTTVRHRILRMLHKLTTNNQSTTTCTNYVLQVLTPIFALNCPTTGVWILNNTKLKPSQVLLKQQPFKYCDSQCRCLVTVPRFVKYKGVQFYKTLVAKSKF